MKFLQTLVLSLGMVFLLSEVVPVAAQSNSYGNDMTKQLQAAAGDNGAALGEPTDPRVTIIYIIRLLLGMVGFLLLILNLYAGFLWFTAGGNDEQITQAKSYLTNGTIGLAIILSSYGITIFIANLVRGYSPLGGFLSSFF